MSCELFAYPDSVTDETTGEDEVDRIVDDLIDVEPVVRDAVVLGLPVTPLCRANCAGLCPDLWATARRSARRAHASTRSTRVGPGSRTS